MFTVYLPRVDDSVQAVKTSSGEISSVGGSETIMVVEDEEDVREMICNLLRSQGYSVLAAENGADALQVWKRHEDPVHMLLTDVVMPSMGGPELADWLAPLRAQMKVVFISGYPGDDALQNLLAKSDFAFLPKPFTRTALLTKVRESLDS